MLEGDDGPGLLSSGAVRNWTAEEEHDVVIVFRQHFGTRMFDLFYCNCGSRIVDFRRPHPRHDDLDDVIDGPCLRICCRCSASSLSSSFDDHLPPQCGRKHVNRQQQLQWRHSRSSLHSFINDNNKYDDGNRLYIQCHDVFLQES